MIDKIRIFEELTLDKDKFDKNFEYFKGEGINQDTGEVYPIDGFFYSYLGLKFSYSNLSNRLSIEGRLPNLLITRDRVNNLDDYLLGIEKITGFEESISKELSLTEQHEQAEYDEDTRDYLLPKAKLKEIDPVTTIKKLDDLVRKANKKLYELTGVTLDIRDFKVTSAEITFNVETPYVKEYIELFNMIFAKRDLKQYVNYVLTMKKKPYTSFYVKSEANFRDNTNRSFTINFYNKENQLEYIRDHKGINVTSEDLDLAKNILRLELKQGYTEVKKDSRRFGDFLEITSAMNKITKKYEWFIGSKNADFYSYQEAKKIVLSAPITKEFSVKKKENLLKEMLQQTQGAKFNYQKDLAYRKKLAILGIHWCFIPKQWSIDRLESPMNMLKKKVDQIEEIQKKRAAESSKYIEAPTVKQPLSHVNDFDF